MIIGMTKNEYTEYLRKRTLTSLPILPIWFVLFLLMDWIQNRLSGFSLVLAVVSVAIFYLLWVIVGVPKLVNKLMKNYEQKVANTRELYQEISSIRNIICEGESSLCNGRKVVSNGWLFLSERALEYYSLQGVGDSSNFAILLNEISKVSIKKNKLIIEADCNTYSFYVQKSKEWAEYINQAINKEN